MNRGPNPSFARGHVEASAARAMSVEAPPEKGAAPAVPAHLRRFVVEQDYTQYTAIDQAVWRFVLLQTHARLVETAHSSYRDGLSATGISIDRIPRIDEMNEKLSRFGWGAVCVDGFVPPRAFQDFQAAGLLPIAADIRTRQHLPYTPAPDIIHEAAGHAPILPDPVYAAYLKRIGLLGARAFTVPEEGEVFEAVHALSVTMEDPARDAAAVARATARLQAATAAVPEVSEAARLSRLYWWTAEYGLVGEPDDYKIYGAGLLSSLGESHSCHAPAVRKVPLDESCLTVAYDITRPQPQLFVARSFEALHELAGRVERDMRCDRATALGRAVRSREVASVGFTSGAWAMGKVVEVGLVLGAPAWVTFEGAFALADGAEAPGAATGAPVIPRAETWAEIAPRGGSVGTPVRTHLVTGRLADGGTLESMNDAVRLDRARNSQTGRHRFVFAGGASVEGRLERWDRRPDGRLSQIDLSDVRVSLPGGPTLVEARFQLWAVGEVVTAHAGARLDGWPPGEAATDGRPRAVPRVPRPRHHSEDERWLLSLYERAGAAARTETGAALIARLGALHDELGREVGPERDWLLAWNMLETLGRVRRTGADGPAPTTAADAALERTLTRELEEMEVAYSHRQPITTGLRYLRSRVG